ncbi:nucleotidyltransferase family protein [Halocynthiibacter styelae]|uniref:Nucleotidyltransferase family protein n=1 Tax=Halocynthiibacter styelae TaxID=2761955 RepID=A0A8J7LQ90_9RHOB|nr:nucleotidyltransferase family protein [Paenihalocynthiibacter styelae]MBI1494012.1 nucleotidyltransferase family protein [Paenihalocynthiibacter styelae]
MSKQFPLMIFAAGKGTRMGELTRHQPKPLVKVAGKALIDHTLTTVENAPVSRTIVNICYFGEMLQDHLNNRDLVFSDESAELLETGGGLRKAAPLLQDSTVFTLNSDAIWRGPDPLQMLADHWDANRMDALLLLITPEQARGHKGQGDFILNDHGQISRGPGYVYTGAQILRTEGLDKINETAFSLNLLWDLYDKSDRLYGLHWPGAWCDVGQPESIPLAEEILKDCDV